MDRIHTEIYKDKNVLIVDYSSITFEHIVDLMNKAKDKIKSSNEKSVLLMEIVRDVKTDNKVSDALNKYAKEINPYVAKYAVVGISGVTRILASTLRIFKIISFELFDDEIKAKEYLVH